MVGKHMPYRPGAFALVGSKQVIELQRAGEQTGKQLAQDRIVNGADTLG